MTKSVEAEAIELRDRCNKHRWSDVAVVEAHGETFAFIPASAEHEDWAHLGATINEAESDKLANATDGRQLGPETVRALASVKRVFVGAEITRATCLIPEKKL